MNPSLFERAAKKRTSRKPLGTDVGRYRALEASAGPIAREFQIKDFGWRRSSLRFGWSYKLSISSALKGVTRRTGALSRPHLAKRHLGVEVSWTYAAEFGNRTTSASDFLAEDRRS